LSDEKMKFQKLLLQITFDRQQLTCVPS
jgi:hypothetical protein